ncbi:hypothetical protein A2U01_0085728, partial [Trifolium medium]|nr:hypothetical protein [Trifolium medium]
VVGCKIFMRAEGIPRDEEEGTNREACGYSNGYWKQVNVGVKVKIRVGLGFDLGVWNGRVQGGWKAARWLMGSPSI